MKKYRLQTGVISSIFCLAAASALNAAADSETGKSVAPISLTRLPVQRGTYEVKGDTRVSGEQKPEALYIGWFDVRLNRDFEWFEAEVAVDDNGQKGEICDFSIANEDKVLKSLELKPGDGPVAVRVKVKGSERLKVSSGSLGMTNRFGRWLNPRLVPDSSSASLLASLLGVEGAAKPDAPAPPEPARAPAEVPILSVDPDGLDDLAAGLAECVGKDSEWRDRSPIRVGVARFKLIPQSLDADNAENVFENLTGSLIKTGVFRVVDSDELDAALEKLQITTTGHIDAASAKKIGELINVQAILVGSVTYDGTIVILNARLVNTSTGEATVANRVVLKRAKS